MGKVYKAYELRVNDEKNGMHKSTLKLPENIEFLSVTGYCNYRFHPTFHISVLEDSSSYSNNLKEYEFLAISLNLERNVSIPVDEYRYIGSTTLPTYDEHEYDIESLYHFDIFVK